MINIPIPLVFQKKTKSKNAEISEKKKKLKNKKKNHNFRKLLGEKLSKESNEVVMNFFIKVLSPK